MPIQASPNRGAAEREFLKRLDRLFGAAFGVPQLLRVTAKFLAEPNGSRVHQMGAADFDDLVKFLRFRLERVGLIFRARE